MQRPALLYLSPVFPDDRGNGLAMRAGMTLEALSLDHDVYLVVAPVYPGGGESSMRLLERCCAGWTVLQPLPAGGLLAAVRRSLRPQPPQSELLAPLAGGVAGAIPGVRFETVHVFRSFTAPLAASFRRRSSDGPMLQLDIDDLEPETQQSIAALLRRDGTVEQARTVETLGERYARQQREVLPWFDRVFVTSEGDAARVLQRYGARDVAVLPNAVRAPEPSLAAAPASNRLLFVGSMGYQPNHDAVAWFGAEVLPRLRVGLPGAELRVVGRGSEGLALEGVSAAGEVPDLRAEYEAACAAVVPVRAGGGTRIKALEAFAHRRAVVATSKAVEGLEVRDGEHLLIANSPEAIVQACERVLADARLRERLAAAAFGLVTERYSLEAVRLALRGAGARSR